MRADARPSLFRREALEAYERPLEADIPELLLPWRNWRIWLVGALIFAAALVWWRF